MKKDKIILHLHLKDSMGNMSTLICRLDDGSIRYILYGGTGSSGTSFSVSNIQFYEVINRKMNWLRDASLPIENLEDETLDQFKNRVIDMLNHSTNKVVKEVNTNVSFK